MVESSDFRKFHLCRILNFLLTKAHKRIIERILKNHHFTIDDVYELEEYLSNEIKIISRDYVLSKIT